MLIEAMEGEEEEACPMLLLLFWFGRGLHLLWSSFHLLSIVPMLCDRKNK
jgi:hypothetical protein